MLRRSAILVSFFGLGLLLGLAGIKIGAQGSAEAQSPRVNMQLLTNEAYFWCETGSPTEFCGDGPGFELLPGSNSHPDRIHFQGPGIDFDCRTFTVPEGIGAVYFNGSEKLELLPTDDSRKIEACEAIFYVN